MTTDYIESYTHRLIRYLFFSLVDIVLLRWCSLDYEHVSNLMFLINVDC